MQYMKTEERFSRHSAEILKKAIKEANGNEVFAAGSIDEDGIVTEIKIAARGTVDTVPALDPYIEKGDVVIHNHPSGRLSPSGADLGVATRIGNSGIGFYIVDNSVENVYVVCEPIRLGKTTKLDSRGLAAALLPGGALSKIYGDYEERQSQVDMLDFVCRGFNEDVICIAEAGTGVGKSLAYLIPAVQWVSSNEERIVISTATINLQQQLIEKDLPLVKKILGLDPVCFLVKGRGNYVCRNRIAEAMMEVTLFEEIHKELDDIYKWSLGSETGSKSDLSFYPSPEVWSRICSETELCSGLWCKHREDCFVLRAKRKAAAANILVANHHLLFSDLALRLSGVGIEATAVLPPFTRIVFDEAHNIEESATSFFSKTYSKFAVLKHLNRFYRKKRDGAYGLLLDLEKKSKKQDVCQSIPTLIDEVMEQADLLESDSFIAMAGESTIYMKNVRGREQESIILDRLSGLGVAISKLCKALDGILEEFEFEEQAPENSFIFESRFQVKRLKLIASVCHQFRDWDQTPESIFWIERVRTHRGDGFARFNITPLVIAPLMKESIYDQYQSIIFTSATLTVGNRFDWWKARVGLAHKDIDRVEQNVFPSPFNYKEHVLLAIPADAPSPDNDSFIPYASDFIARAIAVFGGRALVLFTSYSMLNSVYNEVFPSLEEAGIPALKQGSDDRSRLLNRFKEDIDSVLFATESFWEGVDTPGQALELLILCRLPFKVPSDPIVKARMEDIESKGGNSFFDYSLPEAVIKLKQGFGRLMRRRSDKGTVVILDSRIISKSYGKIFLNSLPETLLSIKPHELLISDIQDFVDKIRE